jgi:vacuolar protein sorting-associated protein IST1
MKERAKVILESKSEVPVDMAVGVHTIFYAAPRTDIPELLVIREKLLAKFGHKLAERAATNSDGLVDSIVIIGLEMSIPEETAIAQHLQELGGEDVEIPSV